MSHQQTTIHALSHDGRGIAQINGKITFIEGALIGETVTFAYTKKHNKYDEAKAMQIHNPSIERVTPQCKHFAICGGCSLQHLNSAAQLSFKQQVLLEQLEHIGGIKPVSLLSPITGPAWGYRYKARLGVKFVAKKNKVLVGFREKKSNFLADIASCEILHPAIGNNLTSLAGLVQSFSIYLQIPQIEVVISDNKTALIFRHLQPFAASDLEKLRQFAKTYRFTIFLQSAGPESVKLFWPENAEKFLQYQIPIPSTVMSTQADIQKNYYMDGVTIHFSPTDFTQVNPVINRQMIIRAIELLNPQKHDRILDLFCGLGNFTIPLAKFCDHVTGIEGDANMVERAQHNAVLNQVDATFYAADLNGEFAKLHWAQQKYTKILLDPPRSGAYKVVEYLPHLGADSILYISCNTATLARDTAALAKQGYKLCQIGVMDMFPHTSHVEAMAFFKR